MLHGFAPGDRYRDRRGRRARTVATVRRAGYAFVARITEVVLRTSTAGPSQSSQAPLRKQLERR